MADARKTAVNALMRVNCGAAYSNIVLNEVLSKSELTGADRALASALFYGVLDRKITLDYIISQFIKTPVKKIAPLTINALRIAVYQIYYMDKIPDSAAVNEAVKLVKGSKESGNSGFVNAVLRNILRNRVKLPDGSDIKSLSVKYSCPAAVVGSFVKDYGTETAKQLLIASLDTPPLTVRVNTLKISAEELAGKLKEQEITAETSGDRDAFILKHCSDISENELYKSGLFYAQDLASQRAIGAADPKPGERVLDICAAPGGKSFTAAMLMQNAGEIISCDLYEQRVRLIESGAKRLGIGIIKPKTANAEIYDETLGKFDLVLCDVPCSGLGVLRRKPEIKYKGVCLDETLTQTQLKILENAARYVKTGGRILYSTCTLRQNENENLVNSFIMRYNMFRKAYEHTYMPHIDKTDGFYCALLIKEGNAPLE